MSRSTSIILRQLTEAWTHVEKYERQHEMFQWPHSFAFVGFIISGSGSFGNGRRRRPLARLPEYGDPGSATTGRLPVQPGGLSFYQTVVRCPSNGWTRRGSEVVRQVKRQLKNGDQPRASTVTPVTAHFRRPSSASNGRATRPRLTSSISISTDASMSDRRTSSPMRR